MWAAVYFVISIAICSFFFANLFVGAVVDSYEKNLQTLYHQQQKKAAGGGSVSLTNAQQKWLRIYRNILNHAPTFMPEPPYTLPKVCSNHTSHL